MSEEKQTDDFELARLVEGAGLSAAGEQERLERWGQAFACWLEERRARGSVQDKRRGRNTWKEFIGFTQALPWQVTTEMVTGYVEWLSEQGRQAGTIGWRLRSISKFYEFTQEFCQREGIEAEGGEGSFKNNPQRPLADGQTGLRLLFDAAARRVPAGGPAAAEVGRTGGGGGKMADAVYVERKDTPG